MKVCVLGSGVMGGEVVSQLAQSKEVSEVIWWGRNIDSFNNSCPRLKIEITKYIKKKALSKTCIEQILSKIVFCSNLNEVAEYEIYIETIVEEVQVKASLLSKLSGYTPEYALVATNTSSLSVTTLAMNVEFPENFIGIHIFGPISIMELVGIVEGLTTTAETLDRTIKFVAALNKRVVIVKESPGFIVNRMLIPMTNEAVATFAEGPASKEGMGDAMKYGENHPIGPLALENLIGNDVCLSIMETLQSEIRDLKYRTHSLLRQYVRAGLVGRE